MSESSDGSLTTEIPWPSAATTDENRAACAGEVTSIFRAIHFTAVTESPRPIDQEGVLATSEVDPHQPLDDLSVTPEPFAEDRPGRGWEGVPDRHSGEQAVHTASVFQGDAR